MFAILNISLSLSPSPSRGFKAEGDKWPSEMEPRLHADWQFWVCCVNLDGKHPSIRPSIYIHIICIMYAYVHGMSCIASGGSLIVTTFSLPRSAMPLII